MSRPRLVKLVRDKIGVLLADERVSYDPVTPKAHVEGLRRKLVEEAIEYVLDPSVDELADVLAVVEALAKHDLGNGGEESMRPVVIRAEQKRRTHGGFDHGIGMYVMTHEPPETMPLPEIDPDTVVIVNPDGSEVTFGQACEAWGRDLSEWPVTLT